MKKEDIIQAVKEEITCFMNQEDVDTTYREPIIGFASATDHRFNGLTKSHNYHWHPKDLLKEGKSIIAYFLPFDERITQSNRHKRLASAEWAKAYVETNTLIEKINQRLTSLLNRHGYMTAYSQATHNFDEELLVSSWSHRHVAYIAGLGTFGLNNMLITKSGCSGRIGTLVTDLKLAPSKEIKQEYCLYKNNGSCQNCVDNCPANAYDGGFDPFKCYELLLENDRYHSDLPLTDVCGKCLVDLPCSNKNPMDYI